MRSKMKSLLGCALTLCMTGALFMGCQSNSKQSSAAADGKVTINYWTLTSSQEQVEQITKEFMEKNPDIVVNVTYNSTDDQKKNLKVAASSNSMPDIWRNWGGSLGSFYTENGLTYDLTSYAKENGWDNKFLPSALDLATFDGKLSGRPFVINALGMFYRKDIFNKYNIKVPTTFEEFEEACATLKKNGITPVSTAGKNGWHAMRILEALIEMYSGSSTHDKLQTLNADWSQESVVKAFEKYKEWIDKGYFPEGFLSADPNDTKLLVYAGTAAMDIQGPWYEANIDADGQDINNYGFFTLPLKEGGNRMSAFIEMIQFNANIDKAKLDAANKYLDYMYSPEVVGKYNLQQPLPYKENAYDKSNVLVPEVVDAMNKYKTFTITDQALPQEVVTKLFEAEDNIALGNVTAEQAAQYIQTAAEDYKKNSSK